MLEALKKLGSPLLAQEYGEHAFEDDNPSDTSNGPGTSGPEPYPLQYQQQNVPPGTAVPMRTQGQPPMNAMQGMHHLQTPQPGGQPVDPNNPMYGTMNVGFDPFDPSLDADPFGLTASMHFPTQFTYHEGSKR